MDRKSVINPSDPKQAPRVFIDRSSDDIYNDPGDPVVTVNELGQRVVLRKNDLVFMTSEGGSSEGSMPYLSTFDTQTKEEKKSSGDLRLHTMSG